MTSTSYIYQREVFVPKEYRTSTYSGPVSVQTNRAVRINDETFSLITSSLLSGINRYSKKRWYRWQETSAYVVSLKKKNPKGKPQLRVYDISSFPHKSILDISASPRSFSTILNSAPFEVQQMFSDFMYSRLMVDIPSEDYTRPWYIWADEVVTPILVKNAYPGLEVFQHNVDWLFAYFGILSGGLREETPIDYTRKLFAKKYYRKDLVKALVAAPLELHSRAVSAAGLVPTDWIIEGLRNDPRRALPGARQFYTAEERRTFRMFLRAVPPRLRRRYVVGEDTPTGYLLDIPRIMNDTTFNIDFRRYRSIQEIHEAWMTNLGNTSNIDEQLTTNGIIPLNKQTEKLISVSIPEFEIVPATTREDLINWSNEMNNCIRGYYYDACQDNKSYLGVYHNGQLMANVEIVDGNVTQFLGKYNNGFAANMDKVKPILNTWINAKAIKPTYQSAWGLK